MPQCKHYEFCKREHGDISENGRCILPSKDPDKNQEAFNKALEEHRKTIGVNFRFMVFPDGAYLSGVDLREADLSGALLYETVFGNTNLKDAEGLGECEHVGPSTIDMRTLRRSWPLPISFLRGIGLDDMFIEYLPGLVGAPIEFCSCFISYSSNDDDFARRLHADLQDQGVRCWFAPEDLKIGAKIRTGIDEAIRLHDKLLLVLSEASVQSPVGRAGGGEGLRAGAKRAGPDGPVSGAPGRGGFRGRGRLGLLPQEHAEYRRLHQLEGARRLPAGLRASVARSPYGGGKLRAAC